MLSSSMAGRSIQTLCGFGYGNRSLAGNAAPNRESSITRSQVSRLREGQLVSEVSYIGAPSGSRLVRPAQFISKFRNRERETKFSVPPWFAFCRKAQHPKKTSIFPNLGLSFA